MSGEWVCERVSAVSVRCQMQTMEYVRRQAVICGETEAREGPDGGRKGPGSRSLCRDYYRRIEATITGDLERMGWYLQQMLIFHTWQA